MSLLHDVHALLAEAGVSHALIGASALLYHGHDRTTADSDLLVVAWAPLQRSFWTLGSEVSIEIRRGDDEDPLAGVVVLVTDDEIVDVVVGRGRWQRELIERADTSGSVPVATLPDPLDPVP